MKADLAEFDEHGTRIDTGIVLNLIHSVRLAKQAFNVPVGDSRMSGNRDYLEEVGRMTIEELNRCTEL